MSSSVAARLSPSASTSEAASADESADELADESADGAASSSAAAPESEEGPESPVVATASSEGAPEPDASAVGDSDEDSCGSSSEPVATAKAPPSEGVSECDGSGDGATQSSEDGSGSKPGSAATAKGAPSKVVEKFDVAVPQTLAEHAASRNFPTRVRTWGPCRFWKHRVKWSASCSATNPVTLKKETWLGHAGGGFGVCLFCAA